MTMTYWHIGIWAYGHMAYATYLLYPLVQLLVHLAGLQLLPLQLRHHALHLQIRQGLELHELPLRGVMS
jgi:hypothetical protein